VKTGVLSPGEAIGLDLRTRAEVRYEITQRIGVGAAGVVYRARAIGADFQRDVCIKRLTGVLAPEHASAMREEARLLATVRHANVVSLLAFGEEGSGAPFLVLELIEGSNLRALCRALEPLSEGQPGHLPDLVAVHVACAILRGLAAVQRALPGLVHRDVTPHNVLVSNEGEVKLADFGIALARDRARWTRPLYVKGKLGYMAPEQARGDPLDPRTDLFAVGVVLYELLTRVRPWGSSRGMEELRAIEQHFALPIVERRPHIDRRLAAVLERLIAWRPCDRYACADDALRALAPFGAGELGSLRLAALVRTISIPAGR
jgi:serine/threonine-protein kinase